MLRTLRNLVLLILICIIASGFPIYNDSLDLHTLSLPAKKSLIDIQGKVSTLSPSHFQVEVILTTTEDEIPITLDSSNPVKLELFYGDKVIKTLNVEDVITYQLESDTIISQDQPLKFNLDLPQKVLDIPDGRYQLKVQPNLVNLQTPVNPVTFTLTYHASVNYVSALKSISNWETALKLYFPDNENKFLIPVTRVIPYTNVPLRRTIDNLEIGPDPNLGLNSNPPIPKGCGIGLDNTVARVYIYKAPEEFSKNSLEAKTTIESLTHSLTSISPVSAVQFYFNRKLVDMNINGRQMNMPQTPISEPQSYLAYITNSDRVLLVPTPIDTNDTSIQSIFNQLKLSSNRNLFSYNLQPTVPEEVELIDHKIENDVLKLKFNKAFLEVNKDFKDRRLMMIESILYTFTSLENINYIQIEVEGRSWGSTDGIELYKPINPPEYINPEK